MGVGLAPHTCPHFIPPHLLPLQAYDRERLAVPSPVGLWEWGWTKSAEIWNGRLAMVGILAIFVLEIFTGQSILKNMMLEP